MQWLCVLYFNCLWELLRRWLDNLCVGKCRPVVLIPHSIAFWSGWNVAGAASYGPECHPWGYLVSYCCVLYVFLLLLCPSCSWFFFGKKTWNWSLLQPGPSGFVLVFWSKEIAETAFAIVSWPGPVGWHGWGKQSRLLPCSGCCHAYHLLGIISWARIWLAVCFDGVIMWSVRVWSPVLHSVGPSAW